MGIVVHFIVISTHMIPEDSVSRTSSATRFLDIHDRRQEIVINAKLIVKSLDNLIIFSMQGVLKEMTVISPLLISLYNLIISLFLNLFFCCQQISNENNAIWDP